MNIFSVVKCDMPESEECKKYKIFPYHENDCYTVIDGKDVFNELGPCRYVHTCYN